jgi:hypothetical protein
MVVLLKLMGIIVLSLLATATFMIVVFGLLSRFTHWLYSHHAAKMVMVKKLLRIPPHDITKHSDSPRYNTKLEVWCEDCFEKAYQWIGSFIRKSEVKTNRDCQSSCQSKRRHNTIAIDFPHNRLPFTRLTFSQSHIRNILNRLRTHVNQSGKEPARLHSSL